VKRYIALFRGVNVGGKSVLPMKSLVEIFEGLGCEEVKTYIQSGNAVFQSNNNRSSDIAKDISSEILKRYGFEPKVLLLEKAGLQETIDNNPFEIEDGKALHFFFLESQPTHPDLEQLMSVKSKSEEFKLYKNVFYLYAPDGIGRSKLAAKVEQALGVPASARNWNTVRKLMDMVGQA
jgi:uncharacterized protein (DUF1697 family)